MTLTRLASHLNERGATLVVVLIMLVVLTLFAISGINLSNLNMKAVGNAQFRKAAEVAGQNAIEQALSSNTNFYSPKAPVAVAAPSGMTVTVGNRVCLSSDVASGYSLAQSIVPEDNYWEVPVTVVDNVSGASVAMHQGTRIRMLANNCPN
jgi:Tfp pilus assembly protein PilX